MNNLLTKAAFGPIRVCAICSRFFVITALIPVGEVLFKDEVKREVVVCEACAEMISEALERHTGWKLAGVEDGMYHTEFAGVEMLRPLYAEITNPDEVKTFLRERVYLMPALLEAPAQIKRFFRSEPLLLEMSTGMDDGPLLTVYIQTTKSAMEANQLIVQFDDTWWLCCVSEEVRDQICIAPDYVL